MKGIAKNKSINVKSNKKESFVNKLFDEVRKIEWTDRNNLKVYLKVVLSGVFILGFGIYFIDLILRFILKTINSLSGLFFG